MEMFEKLPFKEHLPTLIAVVGVLAVMWIGLRLSSSAIRRLASRMVEQDQEHIEDIQRWAGQLTSFVRRAIEIVAGVAAVLIILRSIGIEGLPRFTWEQVVTWLSTHGMRIILVLGGAYVITRVAHLLIERLHIFVTTKGEGAAAEMVERQKRAETLRQILSGVITTVVMIVAVLIVLRELGVDITPIITAAGIGGLAIGFGAQHLVRDILSGFFLLLEDQVRVGDVATINGKTGTVEAIRLRTIVLRSLDGTVHIIPNGAISELSNMTKEYSYAVLDVGVAYKENVDQVMEVLAEVGAEMEKDPDQNHKLLDSLEIFGVQGLDDSSVTIRIRIKTVPVKQWSVARELRRRIKNTFDARGIEIPFPHVSIYMGEASKPFAVETKSDRKDGK